MADAKGADPTQVLRCMYVCMRMLGCNSARCKSTREEAVMVRRTISTTLRTRDGVVAARASDKSDVPYRIRVVEVYKKATLQDLTSEEAGS